MTRRRRIHGGRDAPDAPLLVLRQVATQARRLVARRMSAVRVLMRWTFSDGTTVDLGGNVEGPTLLAQRLRADMERGVRVNIWPPPGGDVALDPNDAALLETWLRQELDFWTRVRDLSLTLKSPPEIPQLPEPPWAKQPHDPTAVY